MTSLNDDDLGLVDALAQLSFLVHDTLSALAARHELSIVQTRLLGILRDREPTMNQLARHLDLDKSSITGLVDRAQRRGLVTRTVSEADRRAYRVSITPAGRDLAEKVATEFAAHVETLAADLPDRDRLRLSRLATRIVTTDAARHAIAPLLRPDQIHARLTTPAGEGCGRALDPCPSAPSR